MIRGTPSPPASLRVAHTSNPLSLSRHSPSVGVVPTSALHPPLRPCLFPPPPAHTPRRSESRGGRGLSLAPSHPATSQCRPAPRIPPPVLGSLLVRTAYTRTPAIQPPPSTALLRTAYTRTQAVRAQHRPAAPESACCSWPCRGPRRRPDALHVRGPPASRGDEARGAAAAARLRRAATRCDIQRPRGRAGNAGSNSVLGSQGRKWRGTLRGSVEAEPPKDDEGG